MSENKNARFTTKDLAFIGVISGTMFVLGFVLALTHHVFPGGPMLTQGPVYAALAVIAAATVRKAWTFTLVGAIVGLLKLLGGCPIFVVIPIVGGFLAGDIFVRAIGHQYCCHKCLLPMGGIMSAVTLALILVFLSLLELPMMHVIEAHPIIAAGIGVGGTVLGVVGAWAGFKIVKELRKAGVVE